MDTFRISNRLKSVAQTVAPGNRVADIGTDHGYLPVYLVMENISPNVIAMDVRKGPLSKAEANVASFNVKNQVELRISDGLDKLMPGEADTITICGMGGKLIQQILENGKDKLRDGMQLVLSPQSELSDFRIYLSNNNIHIVNEIMLKEDEHFYVIMDCRYNKVQSMAENMYGKFLLDKKDLVLKEYLHHEMELNERVLDKLQRLEESPAVEERIKEVIDKKTVIAEALQHYC